VVNNTVYNSDNGSSASTMPLRRDAISSSVDTVQASSASASAVAAMGTDDATAEMDKG